MDDSPRSDGPSLESSLVMTPRSFREVESGRRSRLYFHEQKIAKWNHRWKTWYWSFMGILRRLQTSFERNIFTREAYHAHLERLDILREKYEKLPLPIEIEDWIEWGIENCAQKYTEFTKELQKESLLLGAWSLLDFGRIWYAEWDWTLEENPRRSLLELFDRMFVPMGGVLQDSIETPMTPPSGETWSEEEREYWGEWRSYGLPIVRKRSRSISRRSSTTTTNTDDTRERYERGLNLPFLQRLEEAELYLSLPNGRNIWIWGYFQRDPINISRIGGFLEWKQLEVLKRCQADGLPESFRLGWIQQISLRDYLVYSIAELAKETVKGYHELEEMRAKPLSSLVKEFLCANPERQRWMFTLFLLSNQEDQFLAHIIYDMISNPSDLLKPAPLAEEIYKSLHYSVQKLFKMAFEAMEQKIHSMQNFSEDQIPYDKRIALMKVSDSVRNKAMEKLREMKGTKDSSAKAQQYLDGLLKIPFGMYRREPIFYFFGEFRKRLRHGIDELRKDWEEWKPSIGHGDLWLCQRWGVLFEWWNKSDDWSEHFIESGFQHTLNELDLLQEARTVSSDTEYSPANSDSEDNHENLHVMIPLPSEIEARCIHMEQQWKKWIEEWQQFSVQKTEYFAKVRAELESCVFGHEETKQQIERLLAQWVHGKMEGTVFGFQGPPGVGKTTLAKKGFARCFMDKDGNPRPFGFLPLGGATNGAILEGHHYTYLGSTWGRIVDILMESKCMNPIIYVDEIDKVSQTEHGRELIGIMTHLTDPSQNQEFFDRYFAGIPIDLSKVVFIFSYNDASAVDRILRDRITEIQIHPLTTIEKVHIVQNYSLPEILSAVGYNKGDIVMERPVVEKFIQEFTYEAGVRKLNEKIFEIIRELNLRRLVDPSSIDFPFDLNWEWINSFFKDKPRAHFAKIPSEPRIGLVNGLYATATGVGGLTVIQCVKSPSDSKLHLELTGQQGDVMKESMICAKTLAWNLLTPEYKKNLQREFEEIGSFGLHVHCPEAATPKDGPSAGVAITTAMVSRLTGIAVSNEVAMTGEVDLHGNVHPVGGIEAKLAGALRAGVKRVFLPIDNERDVESIRSRHEKQKRNDEDDDDHFWLNDLEIHFATHIEEILSVALVKPFLIDE